MRNARVLLLALACLVPGPLLADVHLGMGFRVGEVTGTSAILWTRVTASAGRNETGYREPKKRTRRIKMYVPSKRPLSSRQGEIDGAAGEVRVHWAEMGKANNRKTLRWVGVRAEQDFTHQFAITGLEPGRTYRVSVEAREKPGANITATASGTFRTPCPPDISQDVTFTVVTGQSYWDLDDPAGYQIYPAMAKLKPHFVVPTGDTVYLDSEAPRARTVGLARYHWHRMYSLPRHVAFHRHVPGYWEVDDHDSWVDDCWPTKSAPWMLPLRFEQGFAIYREQVPIGRLTYRTIRWGRDLQIWLVEGRLYRSPNSMPDGPGKTIWGSEQLAWLKRTILASDASFRVLISPTPIVGPDRTKGKNDNHSNAAFATEGNHFRNWTRQHRLTNFFVCCGDRHWQYLSVDPATGLREFSCGPASNEHAGGTPGRNPKIQPFHRVKGGFLSVQVARKQGRPAILFRHHGVRGQVFNEYLQVDD
ncbi:MAG: alkaline phosphatase D family protein [Planctomycetota bacterium]|nr:alkaline phosphatase D family protein [Planctomycetota bacterium]